MSNLLVLDDVDKDVSLRYNGVHGGNQSGCQKARLLIINWIDNPNGRKEVVTEDSDEYEKKKRMIDR